MKTSYFLVKLKEPSAATNSYFVFVGVNLVDAQSCAFKRLPHIVTYIGQFCHSDTKEVL